MQPRVPTDSPLLGHVSILFLISVPLTDTHKAYLLSAFSALLSACPDARHLQAQAERVLLVGGRHQIHMKSQI